MRFRDKANIESGKTPTYVLLSTTNIAPWLKYDAKATRSEKIGYLSRDSSLFYRTGWIFILFAPVKSVYKSRTDSKEHFVLSKLLLFRLKNFMSIFKRKEFRETDFQRDRDFFQIHDRNVALSAFDRCDVCSVQFAKIRQRFLWKSHSFPQLSDSFPDLFFNHSYHLTKIIKKMWLFSQLTMSHTW